MAIRISALSDPSGEEFRYRLVWLAVDETANPVGYADLVLPADVRRARPARGDLHVHPAERGRGVGTELLDTLVAAAREARRPSLRVRAELGSPGDRFLTANGLRKVLTLSYARLVLAEMDTAALREVAEAGGAGYRIAAWDGPVPEELVGPLVAARFVHEHESELGEPTAPQTAAEAADDAERLRALARAVDRRGNRLRTVVAVDQASGEVAALTELLVPASGQGEGRHRPTWVLPDHRGRGLARWIVAEALLRVRAELPELTTVITDTPDSNSPMRMINDSVGYRPMHRAADYQLDL